MQPDFTLLLLTILNMPGFSSLITRLLTSKFGFRAALPLPSESNLAEMRLSDIEVKVKSPGGSLFHEVLDPNTGSVYVVASPGSLFEIHVIASPNNFFGGGPGGRLFLARCSVDGRELGHSVVLSARHPALKFVGFVREGNSKSITYDLFKFAAATPDDGTSQAESLEFKEGSIIITISEVVDLGQTEIEYNIAQSKDLQNGAKVPSLPEGKKFFLAPSLTTASGGAHKTSGFSNTKYGMVSTIKSNL